MEHEGLEIRRRFRLGLTGRFTLFVAALQLALAASLVLTQSVESGRSARAILDSKIAWAASLVDAEHYVSAAKRGVDDFSVLMAALRDDDDLAYVFAVTEEGRILGLGRSDRSRNVPFTFDALASEAEADGMPATREEGDIVHVAVPAGTVDGKAATVRLGFSLTGTQDATAAAVARHLLVALAILMLALPLTAIVMGYVTEPLRSLIAATRRITAGDYAVTLPTRRHDEIGELAEAFSVLAGNLAESSQTVNRLTFRDALTGVASREALERRYEEAARLSGQPVALLLIDVDRLARINDALGRDKGDEVIRSVATRLRATADAFVAADAGLADPVREILVARLGGGEFCALVVGAGEGRVAELAQAVIDAFQAPIAVGRHGIGITVTIGAALDGAEPAGLPQLLGSAAVALRQAKETGLGTYAIGHDQKADVAYRRLIVEQELRQAIERGELSVYYQPKVALTDGRPAGAEALVRWRHPLRGLVPPDEFLGIAEESGFMDTLGDAVAAQVATDIRRFLDRGLQIPIAINVSASQFDRGDLASRIQAAFEQAGAPLQLLEIEITESTAMREPARIAEILAPLRETGVRLAIDDFGTGYSNLLALTHLPFDVLKIDRSFVASYDADPNARVVVGAMLAMARSLGYSVVAEGIEDEQQRGELSAAGCTYGQGFLFGRPMPAETFIAWYVERQRQDARALRERVARAAKTY